MFKMFAIMCFVVWTEDGATTELQCTRLYEDPPRQFTTMRECDSAAQDKLVATLEIFEQTGTHYDSIQVGCESTE